MKTFCVAGVFMFLFQPIFAQLSFESELNTGYNTNNNNTFTDIPLKPHKNNVDIFFNAEKPKQDFYKVRVIEVTGTNGYNDLLQQIKIKAQNEGFDGLMILGTSNNIHQDNRIGTAIVAGTIAGLTRVKDYEYQAPIISEQSLAAIAIKYKSQMQYITTIPKNAKIIFYNDSIEKYSIDFLLNGLFKELGNSDEKKFYLQNISLFNKADFFTTYKKYDFAPLSNEGDNMTAKLFSDSGNIKYSASYISPVNVSGVEIKVPASNVLDISSKRYLLTYDLKDGRISKRYIHQGRHADLLYTDEYFYDDKNRCTGFVRYNQKGIKLFTIQYNFFSDKDLPEAEK